MAKILNFQEAEKKIISNIRDCIEIIRKTIDYEFNGTIDGIAILVKLRQLTYEDLNQIQHEELSYRAAKYLKDFEFKGRDLNWYWNPRQTGNHFEPDLQATENEQIVVSAEVTTSDRPIGIIDSRMRDTLKKLSEMAGKKYYFVRTKEMEKRARTKVAKLSTSIKVIKI